MLPGMTPPLRGRPSQEGRVHGIQKEQRSLMPAPPVHAYLMSGAHPPVSDVLQLEDVHGLGVARGTEEL